jgi:glycosyltransferase involved in cell wall biosynthesis
MKEIKNIDLKSVIYVGPFSFPNGGASARRILGITKSIQMAGYDVKIACGQMEKNKESPQWYEGIEVHSLNERTAEHMPRMLKHMAYLNMGKKTVAWLDAQDKKPYAVILYSGYSPYIFHLYAWARRNGVRLIFDAVEWYESVPPFWILAPYQLNVEFALRYLLPKIGHIISISSYFNDYYKMRGCQSIIIPPTLDVLSTKIRVDCVRNKIPLELVYAGSPGRKDLLDNIIEAVVRVSQAGSKLHLSVAGVSEKDARNYKAVNSRSAGVIASCVSFLGIISHEESMNLVRHADYTLLLRKDARYAHAGFPTKFVESLALGTPVIANLTSDLHIYLKDSETGFICVNPTPEGLVDALSRALDLTEEKHSAIRIRCREVAEASFDYRAFAESLGKFLNSLSK